VLNLVVDVTCLAAVIRRNEEQADKLDLSEVRGLLEEKQVCTHCMRPFMQSLSQNRILVYAIAAH
jgi:hypothetical protein